MKENTLKTVLVYTSICIVILLACSLIIIVFKANGAQPEMNQTFDEQGTVQSESYQQSIEQSTIQPEHTPHSNEQDVVTVEMDSQDQEEEEFPLLSTTSYYQLYYGKWVIVDFHIPNSGILPRSYNKYDENGSFIGWDIDRINGIIGEEIVFDEDYAEFSGERHYYVCKPVTFSRALLSDEEPIGRYTAGELGITGNYYSVVYFLLPGHYWIAGFENHVSEVRIDDLFQLFLKDNNTIYACEGSVMYRLERVD